MLSPRALIAVLVPLLVGGIALAAIQANSAGEQPDGVFGLGWGQPIPAGQGFKIASSDGLTLFFEKRGTTFSLGSANLQDVYFGFFDNRFYATVMTYQGLTQFRRLVFALETAHGKATISDDLRKRYTWHWPDVELRLSLDTRTNRGNVTYLFLPIAFEREEAYADRRTPGGYGAY